MGILLLTNILMTNIISASPFYYKISMDYNKDVIDIKEIGVIFSQEDLTNGYGSYNIETIDANNKKIDSQNFVVPNTRFYDKGENGNISEGGSVVLENVSFIVYAPYYANAKEIIIYDKTNKELTKADVSMYSRITEKENVINNVGGDKDEYGCLIAAGYSWCEEKQNCIRTWEETCSSAKKTEKTSGNNLLENISNYWWVLIIILIILIIILAYAMKKKR